MLMQKASASIRYISMIYVANVSITIRSLTSEMKPHPVGLTGLNRVLMGFNGENWVIKYWSFGQILEGSY